MHVGNTKYIPYTYMYIHSHVSIYLYIYLYTQTHTHTLEHGEHTATAVRSNRPLVHLTIRIDF